jgi:hypothetical protein
MIITPKTSSVDLFRIMYSSEDIHPTERTVEQLAAHREWERRLDACQAEHGSCYDRRRRYEAYRDGRNDELKIRGEDLRIAKTLLARLDEFAVGVGRELTASDLIRLRAIR